MAEVVVVGSLVADIVLWLPRFPEAHETLLASRSEMHPGGKGLCQAIAAARCGASAAVIGCVGQDGFGTDLLAVLESEGVDHASVRTDPIGTSLGIPMISPDGGNRIIGVPRANTILAPSDIEDARPILRAADVLVLQLEVPLESCWAALDLVDHTRCTVVWNPAPAVFDLDTFFPISLAGRIHWLTPNEVEASQLTDVEVTDVASALASARRLQAARPGVGVVVTLGAQGVVALTPQGTVLQLDAHPVDCVDSTGAGDAFTGAFATALARGDGLPGALAFANAAGALATTLVGAATGLPTAGAIDELLSNEGAS